VAGATSAAAAGGATVLLSSAIAGDGAQRARTVKAVDRDVMNEGDVLMGSIR